jgi:3-phosphoshikimate 1-carboxyvinyltransferase
MALPDLIEIVPLKNPVRAKITVPGSKSITNRALILAALAEGEIVLKGALWSEDTQVMTEALQRLGFFLTVEEDRSEFCNRTITVRGGGGRIPQSGTEANPLELFVGNAGTAARFLSALVCLGQGVYRLSGVPRMHERPQAALFAALRELGYRIEPENGNEKLPARIYGSGKHVSRCKVSVGASSQFASALLLGARPGGWQVEVTGQNADESPYVAMTERMIDIFPAHGEFQIEPDASSGSYFWGAGWLVHDPSASAPAASAAHLPVVVNNWPASGWQIDADFPKFLPLPAAISRNGQLGDSIMTAIVLAADAGGTDGTKPPTGSPVQFTDLGRLRVQECERVVALKTELIRCGASVVERGDTLLITPARLHGAEIETYADHRMAMCFAILGLKIAGIKIKNPACVKKTFPNFFQKLAAPAPLGLGAEIWEVKEGKRAHKLAGGDLFADQFRKNS